MFGSTTCVLVSNHADEGGRWSLGTEQEPEQRKKLTT